MCYNEPNRGPVGVLPDWCSAQLFCSRLVAFHYSEMDLPAAAMPRPPGLRSLSTLSSVRRSVACRYAQAQLDLAKGTTAAIHYIEGDHGTAAVLASACRTHLKDRVHHNTRCYARSVAIVCVCFLPLQQPVLEVHHGIAKGSRPPCLLEKLQVSSMGAIPLCWAQPTDLCAAGLAEQPQPP